MMEMSKLRIAMLSAHSCPVGNLGAKDTGGMSVYIRELAHELGKQGHCVDIYTRVHDLADPQIIDLGHQAQLIHLKAGDEEDIHKLALYSYLPDFACNLENYRRNNELQYDLIFSHYWLSGWVGRYLQMWWQVPHIAMFHTLGAVKNNIGIGEDEPELRIVNEGETVRDCHRIIASTEGEKEELVRYYGASPDKVGVVPCGVNMGLFQPIDRSIARMRLDLSVDKLLLFVGRIDPLKGLEQLLKAIPYIQNIEGMRLLIIGGDGDSQREMERLYSLSCELGIQDMVAFRGLVRHNELPYFYSAADICIVPSYYESFGLVALESLSCGTPVIATEVGNLRNIMRQGENGYILKSNSPHEIAEKIDILSSERNSEIESSWHIRETVSGYSWTNITEAIVGEFRQVLSDQMSPVA